MKNKISKSYIYIVLIGCILFLSSCYQPSPLTGTWADNKGSQITLFPDYTFAAKITGSFDETKSLEGTYNVMLNAIVFTVSDGYQIVSEWDIRGSMLYLEWPDEKEKTLQLILYKTKN